MTKMQQLAGKDIEISEGRKVRRIRVSRVVGLGNGRVRVHGDFLTRAGRISKSENASFPPGESYTSGYAASIREIQA